MLKRVARELHQRNRYVVNQIGKTNLKHLISVANVLHTENPKTVGVIGLRDITLVRVYIADVYLELAIKIPKSIQMGKVYWPYVIARAYHDGVKNRTGNIGSETSGKIK